MDETLIKEINIYPVKPKNGLIAFASCLYNNRLSLNSIAVYTRPDGNGYRLVYPSKTLPNGKTINIFYPIDRDIGQMIEKNIAKKIEKLAEKVKGESSDGSRNAKCANY